MPLDPRQQLFQQGPAVFPALAAGRGAQAASPPVVPGDPVADAAAPAAPGPPGPAAPAAAGGVTAEPAAISCRAPAYPPAARRRGETGTVEMRLLIDVDGRVTDSALEGSSGSAALDAAALAALSDCRFKPGLTGGQPHPAWIRLRYVWELE
ncbi:energy transducer TonB [Zavarzinia sp.]|uniref:energy transducer TonB n=1 Tax=Zavarzinia sp. TaxID=2027920 RepID=UPI003563406C